LKKSVTVILMKKNLACLGVLFLVFSTLLTHFPLMAQTRSGSNPSPSSSACPAILQHQFARLQDEALQNLCQFSGKVVLVVNTASYCGFTSQYESLEALYAKYQSKGLVVLGFPSNDFGKQEPGSAKEIADLCFNTYGVKFPMFSKSVVSGPGASAFYASLAKATGQVPQWNFHKYLIDRTGKVVSSFASNLNPQSPVLTGPLEQALAQKL
jgi:glutathione peroxidase